MKLASNALTAEAVFYRNHFDLREAFERDAARFPSLSLSAPAVTVDMSKCLWDRSVVTQLMELARASELETRRAGMFEGKAINETEGRPVLHAGLRAAVVQHADSNVVECNLASSVLDMLELAQKIRRNPDIQDVVHIGIGGSTLGPKLVCQALADFKSTAIRMHFVSNIDAHQLDLVLQNLWPANTVFVVASKSFSTLETLRNAQSAMRWFAQHAPDLKTHEHFVAITAKPEKAQAMGFGAVLGMPEGIGGRFSLWSSIGLPIAIAIGPDHFKALLQGGCAMDQHFLTEPLEKNLPVWLGLLDVWNSTYLQFASRCVVPYHHGLRRLPAFLQQLDMESNGKRVKYDGEPVDGHTGQCVWGDVGSDSQHAFFQWLHQGTRTTPVEFVVVKNPCHLLQDHHQALLANAIAQSQALMLGQSSHDIDGLPGHQDFPGNKPSCFFVLDRLTPYSLGAFLALQEHRVFVAGTVWAINSFDQWGVELGKALASEIELCLHGEDLTGLDQSTASLVKLLRLKI